MRESDLAKVYQGEDLVDWSYIMEGEKEADLCIRYKLTVVTALTSSANRTLKL